MGRRANLSFILIICIFATFAVACLVAILPGPLETCLCNEKSYDGHMYEEFPKADDSHKLAIIVPFRDRFDELLIFVPHMKKFLTKQKINYHIFVINQVDQYRFNRASLINIGFLHARDKYDYIAMHDVDLLPLNDNLDYGYPKDGPFHVASPELHPKYNYSTFVGGILLVNRDHFEMVNGMSNKYWGWGLEDDEFYVRLKEAKLKVRRPVNILTNRTNTFSHNHDRTRRKRDTVKCFNQYEATRRRDRETGLDNVAYEETSQHKLTIDALPLTVINVKLSCDKKFTPWCDCSQSNVKKQSNNQKKL